jgi:hypothetical protein
MGRKNDTKGTKLEREKKTEEKSTLRMKNMKDKDQMLYKKHQQSQFLLQSIKYRVTNYKRSSIRASSNETSCV